MMQQLLLDGLVCDDRQGQNVLGVGKASGSLHEAQARRGQLGEDLERGSQGFSNTTSGYSLQASF